MGILYGARFARFDLLRQTTKLATRISKWTSLDDRRLLQLVRWIWSSLDLRQAGWVGDPTSKLGLNLFTDADSAGGTMTQRSTSGIHMAVRGPHTLFPLAGSSAAQRAVATSTPGAELATLHKGYKSHMLPTLD